MGLVTGYRGESSSVIPACWEGEVPLRLQGSNTPPNVIQYRGLVVSVFKTHKRWSVQPRFLR